MPYDATVQPWREREPGSSGGQQAGWEPTASANADIAGTAIRSGNLGPTKSEQRINLAAADDILLPLMRSNWMKVVFVHKYHQRLPAAGRR
jgi:hypothetical protein